MSVIPCRQNPELREKILASRRANEVGASSARRDVSAVPPGRRRFLHPPRTAGRSLRYAWGLRPPEYRGHAPPADDDGWRYGFARNPWDRVVSLWCLLRDSVGPFRAWVRSGLPGPTDRLPVVAPCSTWLRDADWVGRFERFETDVVELASVLGRPAPTTHVGESVRERYPTYYDDETREIVSERYAEDVERWGYEFGEG